MSDQPIKSKAARNGVLVAITAAVLAISAVLDEDAIKALIPLLALAIVWLYKFVFSIINKVREGKGLSPLPYADGKLPLTIALFVISVGLTLISAPPDLQPFPVCTEPASCMADIASWFAGLVTLSQGIIAAATLLYNLLLSDVLDQLNIKLVSKLVPAPLN